MLVATQEHSSETAVDKTEEGGDDVEIIMPLMSLGHTRTTMVVNRGRQYREVEQIPKSHPSSDCRLKPACMKLESLVIADQHAAVNTFPGLVHTARHTMRVGNTRSP